ncbi:MAG TPA: hypothetical protein PKZ65_09850 [Methanoregulaceae archaeon]|nr:hypothetical protein [Methanoregulaceae archaeon]
MAGLRIKNTPGIGIPARLCLAVLYVRWTTRTQCRGNMREEETFLVVVGILAVLVLAFSPVYLRFLKKMLGRRQTPLSSPAPLQKKPVIAFDRAWTTLAKAYATARAEPEEPARLPPPPRTAAPAPQPAPATIAARTRAASPMTAARPAVRSDQVGSEIPESDIRSGYVRIVNQARCIQDRIRLSREIRTAISPENPLEGQEAVRFNENIMAIDQLAGRYSFLYGNLRFLMENETAIASPEVLQEHRQKESETIRQIAAVTRQLQPLLNENEDIVAPFVGDLR